MEIIANKPENWQHLIPRPDGQSHKYRRGHAIIFAAPELTGATRLAAEACSRIGAGLVTVLAGKSADIYRTTLPADIMVHEQSSEAIKGVTAMLGGAGGIRPVDRSKLYATPNAATRIFDAGALPTQEEFSSLDPRCILTPHEGEFDKTFGDSSDDRPARALEAAARSNAIVVLKGARTLIANPDGRLVENTHSSPYLAKAGTGDVLAGMITGLAAQGMEPFDAACAAVWIHGDAGLKIGPGLVATDIASTLPKVLKELL